MPARNARWLMSVITVAICAGVDPATDRRPRVLAAVIGSVVFLANRDWLAAGREDPEAMAAAFDGYADALRAALAGRWAAR
jgi:hypothetical protein